MGCDMQVGAAQNLAQVQAEYLRGAEAGLVLDRAVVIQAALFLVDKKN